MPGGVTCPGPVTVPHLRAPEEEGGRHPVLEGVEWDGGGVRGAQTPEVAPLAPTVAAVRELHVAAAQPGLPASAPAAVSGHMTPRATQPGSPTHQRETRKQRFNVRPGARRPAGAPGTGAGV